MMETIGLVLVIILIIVAVLGFIFGCMLAFSTPLWFLWNWLVTSLFHIRSISIFEALGLMILLGIVFGRFKVEVKAKA